MNRPNMMDRATFDKVQARFGADAKVRISYLRQEIAFNNTKTQYRFDFNAAQRAVGAERKLAEADAFYVTGVGLYLNSELTARPGTGKLACYPNAQTLLTPMGAAYNAQSAADLEAFFNANMKVIVNQEIVFDSVDTRRMRVVPQTQFSSVNDQDEQQYGDGIVALEPRPTFSGKRTNAVEVEVPTWASGVPEWAARTAGWENRLVCYLTGLYIPGGASNAAA